MTRLPRSDSHASRVASPSTSSQRGEADAQPLLVILMCALMIAAVGWLLWGDETTVQPVGAPTDMDASGERVARQDAEAARLPGQGAGERARVDVESTAQVEPNETGEALSAVDTIALHGIVVDGSDQPVEGARVAVFQDHMTSYARWFEFGPEEIEEVEEAEESFDPFAELEFEELELEVEETQADGMLDMEAEEPMWVSTLSDPGGRFVLELPADALERDPLISASAEGFVDAEWIPLTNNNFQVLRLETPASVRLPVRMPLGLEDDHRAVLHVERNGWRVLSTAIWSYADEEQPELKGLEPGAYRVVIEVGCAYWPVYEAEFDLMPGEVHHLDEARLDETVARVHLELRTVNGMALANAEVKLSPGAGSPSGSTTPSASELSDSVADEGEPKSPAPNPTACMDLFTDSLGQIWLTVPRAELPMTLSVTTEASQLAGSLTIAHADAPGVHILTLAP